MMNEEGIDEYKINDICTLWMLIWVALGLSNDLSNACES